MLSPRRRRTSGDVLAMTLQIQLRTLWPGRSILPGRPDDKGARAVSRSTSDHDLLFGLLALPNSLRSVGSEECRVRSVGSGFVFRSVGRVGLGGCPPRPPTDSGLHITRTRFLIS